MKEKNLFKNDLLTTVWNMDPNYYSAWVHTPIIINQTPDFLKNKYINIFSMTYWWIIPIVWYPISFYFLYLSFTSNETYLHIFYNFAIGLFFVWTLFEYILHRFLFHIDIYMPKYKIFCLIHFSFHGIHHLLPMDKFRLVFPPIAGLPIALLVYYLLKFYLNISNGSFNALMSGLIFGYTIYDLTHYYLHYGNPSRSSYFGKIKSNHLKHHYSDHTKSFGVSSNFWDNIFSTNFQ